MQSPYPAPAKTLRLGDALEVGGSLVVFAFSFAPFVRSSIPFDVDADGLAEWLNAWAAETFMAPLTWFVILAGLLQIGAVALRLLGGRSPELLGFRLPQLELGLGLFMLVVLFGMVTSAKNLIFGASEADMDGADLKTGWGAILMLIGALAAAVGGVLTHLSVGPVIFSRPAGPVSPPAAGQPYAAPPAAPGPAPGPPPQPPAGPPQSS